MEPRCTWEKCSTRSAFLEQRPPLKRILISPSVFMQLSVNASCPTVQWQCLPSATFPPPFPRSAGASAGRSSSRAPARPLSHAPQTGARCSGRPSANSLPRRLWRRWACPRRARERWSLRTRGSSATSSIAGAAPCPPRPAPSTLRAPRWRTSQAARAVCLLPHCRQPPVPHNALIELRAPLPPLSRWSRPLSPLFASSVRALRAVTRSKSAPPSSCASLPPFSASARSRFSSRRCVVRAVGQHCGSSESAGDQARVLPVHLAWRGRGACA